MDFYTEICQWYRNSKIIRFKKKILSGVIFAENSISIISISILIISIFFTTYIDIFKIIKSSQKFNHILLELD